ncbi:hypothetical protein I7I50_04180 [Histoplasma capsulatum G186AR]|uniref:Uncharacterized protein n=1 Tax=Ajellomyces capsulatus TaxID=5037 RepID=A0A8H8CX00_AJECA|nr:hypothetical protein I7I52_05088 [Histoplasma capsulatum]QSS75138.1 hypothetical protein I7I50_04180 [Histoplasma capsulatum G186AR]
MKQTKSYNNLQKEKEKRKKPHHHHGTIFHLQPQPGNLISAYTYSASMHQKITNYMSRKQGRIGNSPCSLLNPPTNHNLCTRASSSPNSQTS